MPNSLFQAVSTITSAIALDAGEARGFTLEVLIACGVVLLVFAFLLNLSFSLLKARSENRVNRDKTEKRDKTKRNGGAKNERS
jgi:ABC-type phosphate transport system permease subunit